MPSFFSEYLSPTNPIASGIVTFLQCFFFIWLVGLVIYGIWLFLKSKQIGKIQNVQPLVNARQKRDVGNGTKINTEDVFHKFCEEQALGPSSPITKHLKAIFFPALTFQALFSNTFSSPVTAHLKAIFVAGWEESRLEVSELINHTTSNLFRLNNLFRSVLAVFIVIGLLGTLFGLADSLAELSPALTTENSERMPQALSDLMGEIKGALAPSIWGILFTIAGVIVYGIYLQIACHPTKSILERLTLTVWVPQLYPTTSQKLIQTLRESEVQMRSGYETAVRVDGLVENIHTNVDEFNKSLTQAKSITEPLAESGTKINTAASSISTAAAELNEGFTESLNDFADVLNKGFLRSLSEFSEKFTSSVTQLTGFQDEIRKLHQEFQQVANQKLEQQTEKLNQQNENLVQVSNALGQALTVLKDYETAYIESRKQIDDTLQAFISKATETNTSIYTENREWFEKMTANNHQQISAMQERLEGNLQTLKQNLVDELKNVTSGLAEKLGNFQKALDSRLEVLNERLENFDTPLKETVEAFKQDFDERLTTLNDQLEKFPEPIQKSADQMRGTFANLVQYMRGIVGDLQREIKEQNEKYEAQLTGVKDLNESVKNLLIQLDKSSKNQREAVNTLSTNVNGLTADIKNLDGAINTFTSDSGKLSQSIAAIERHAGTLGTASQELVQKADVTPLNTNIGTLNATIEQISQNAQTLADAVDQLTKQIDLSRTGEPEGNRRERSLLSKLNPFSRRKTDGR